MDQESSSKRAHEGEHVGETKRHASESERSGMRLFRATRPNKKPQSYRDGHRIQLSANFFRLPKLPEWSIYKYQTEFEPECLLARLRNAMIAQHKDQIGGFIFDGVQLFVTRELPNEVTVFESRAKDETVYKITCKFTKVVSPNSRDYIQVLNLILRRANAALNWKLVNRSYYDANAMIDLSQFKLQLWPGFQTTIQNYRNDILVNCDVIHKAMRTDTVYSIMVECHAKDHNDFENSFKQQILGKTVLTDYNNQTYCVDDIDFNINPESTFKKGDQDISIRDYYAQKYQKIIRDLKQPILISKLKDRSLRGGIQKGPIWLVPELCRMTGLSEQQRNNIALKNAMKPFSQMIPKIRRQRILEFNNRVQTMPTSVGVFTEWNIGLDREMVRFDGYRIGPEFLRFADQERQVSNGGWNRECGPNMNVYQTASLNRWYVIYPRQMEREITKFFRRVVEIGKKMNFHISTPKAVIVSHDRELASKVNELVNSSNPQMLFFGVAGNKNSNTDTYAAIKKRCFGENAIASQVVTSNVLSRDKGYDSIITKIAIQMCTKLGGAPWTIRIPVRGVMTIGFDVSKDTQNKNLSFGCMVATMDLQESANFFTHCTSYSNTETLAKEFGIGVRKAIDAWQAKYAGSLPGKIVIYRGGISDGELSYLVDVEVKLIEGRLKEIYESQGAEMQLAFIVVTKKVNVRIFEGENNPEPGTVVDDVITMSERYEFFLVSQSCTQGTVSPTNYNIIYDNFDNWQINRFATWSYKQTHLYYNWTGTTRTPAPLQYATKLCFMVCNFLHQQPNNGLENSLYFL